MTARKRSTQPQTIRPPLSREDAKTRLIGILQQSTVLLLAILGFLFSLTTSYQLTILTGRSVWSALFFVILFIIVYSAKRRELLLLISFLAALVWVWLNSDMFMQGILVLVEQGLSPLSLHLPDFLQAQIHAYDAQQAIQLTTTGVQVVVFLTTLFSGYFVIYRSSLAGLALSTLPLLLPATFFSLEPSVVPFFCLASAYIMLFIRSSVRRIPTFEEAGEDNVKSPKRQNYPAYNRMQHLLTLLALPLIILTALISSILLPQRGYERPEGIEALQEKILSLQLGDIGQRSNDGLTRGNLRTLSAIRFTGDIVLKVRTTLEKPFYLRDYVGSYFTNDGWVGVSDSYYHQYANYFSGIAPQNLSADATIVSGTQYQPYTLSVQNIDATSNSIWSPNGLLTTAGEISGAAYLQDAALYFERPSDSDEYMLTAMTRDAVLTAIPLADDGILTSTYLAAAGSAIGLQDASGSDAELIQSAAQAYINYIFDVYTDLPDDTQQAAKQLCEKYNLAVRTEDGALDLFETCHDLYNLLTTQCSYAYSPPEIPSGTDFATYFLEESRQGYCVHFATSATVLLRSLGIPARYAEGYIVVSSDYNKQPDADGYIDIEDTHAHAWVEVFDPAQLEWIPFEMTASSRGSSSATPDPDDTGDEGYTETPEPTPTPTVEPTPKPPADATSSDEPETDETPTPGPSDSADLTPSAESSEDQAESFITPTPDFDSQDGSGEEDGTAHSSQSDSSAGLVLWPFLVVLLSGGLLFAAYSWRKSSIKRLKRQLRQRNINASVLAVCRYSLDMLRFAGCEPLQPLQTPEEYAAVVTERLSWIERERLQTILELAQLARFSDTVCTRQDWNETAAFAAAIHAGLNARLPRVRRWFFRWRFPVL